VTNKNLLLIVMKVIMILPHLDLRTTQVRPWGLSTGIVYPETAIVEMPFMSSMSQMAVLRTLHLGMTAFMISRVAALRCLIPS
jgi:hypothetical protein